jgi:hypothetical protein
MTHRWRTAPERKTGGLLEFVLTLLVSIALAFGVVRSLANTDGEAVTVLVKRVPRLTGKKILSERESSS